MQADITVDEHTFIIRVWSESREIEGARPVFRWMIRHGQSGKTRYLEDVDEIQAFIAPYLEQMGVRLGKLWHIRQWLKHQKLPRPLQAGNTQTITRRNE